MRIQLAIKLRLKDNFILTRGTDSQKCWELLHQSGARGSVSYIFERKTHVSYSQVNIIHKVHQSCFGQVCMQSKPLGQCNPLTGWERNTKLKNHSGGIRTEGPFPPKFVYILLSWGGLVNADVYCAVGKAHHKWAHTICVSVLSWSDYPATEKFMIFPFTSLILTFASLWWSGTKPPISPRSACIHRDPEKFRLRSPQLEMRCLHKGPQHSDSCGECQVSGLRDAEDAFSPKLEIQTTPPLGHSV